MTASSAPARIADLRASLSAIASAAFSASVTSRPSAETPMIDPSAPRIGDVVTEMSSRRPSLVSSCVT